MPLSLRAPLTSARWQRWPRAGALGLGASFAVEAAQLLISVAMGFAWRVANKDDLILNTTGTLIGS